MSVLTILCHGTDNSRDTNTSSGHTLVISKIAELLQGVEGTDWLLLEGAGTEKLREQGVDSNWTAGVFWGAGVQANVDKAVKFATDASRNAVPEVERVGNRIRFTGTTVNLAGHSRGSITCYKIAHALRKFPGIKVNIFAIDPVPGNNGRINKEMHDHIKLGDNVANSFLMLAESEHRLNFRPYVDALYCIDRKEHKFDTIPGTHGGINELGGDQHEAADIVLSRAVKFLKKQGSRFTPSGEESSILGDSEVLRLYALMMMRIKQYKRFASVSPFGAHSRKEAGGMMMNLVASSFQVEKHRIVNVADDKLTWGGAKPKGLVNVAKVRLREGLAKHTKAEGRAAHHGLNMSAAVERMVVGRTGDTEFKAHSLRPNRFFANQQHEKLFGKAYPSIFASLQRVERGSPRSELDVLGGLLAGYVARCSPAEMHYMEAYFAARQAA
jgi:hypothetical protein